MKKRFYFLGVILSLAIFLILVLIFRFFSSTQLDDVSPEISCETHLLLNSDVLFVIPKFNNRSISQNPDWCKMILGLNKTLGLHGVYHSYNEFGISRDERYLQEGIQEFYNCFGFYPEIFKAPQLNISEFNKNFVDTNLEIYSYINQFFHKVYHCGDSGKISNKLISFF